MIFGLVTIKYCFINVVMFFVYDWEAPDTEIDWEDLKTKFPTTIPDLQLYEEQNLFNEPKHQETIRSMKEKLIRWQIKNDDSFLFE